ncbi:hypothetical protein CLOACE_10280 [Clostridium acetireducens DSM 10703]|jgi:hypothetical protein|uniref:DUF1292 domain-containing protein n=1 Tax=Clostridium acetireducens DSM 10703 TaxID=1121290 RepID=A0A1E8EZI7_9CLOT|nr:DUF1292 domain-containing protein [Clostridium acetireducens]OFI06528.1 hypothetical protein CLOACE_10280 [Clostridium acetireducens DSM 10703]
MDKEKINSCGCGEENHECHDEHCGCGCGEETHEAIMVDLEDENGNTVPCEVVDGFRYKDTDYVLVQNPEDESVYLFKIVGEGEEGELVIPDDQEFEEASAYYEELTGEE